MPQRVAPTTALNYAQTISDATLQPLYALPRASPVGASVSGRTQTTEDDEAFLVSLSMAWTYEKVGDSVNAHDEGGSAPKPRRRFGEKRRYSSEEKCYYLNAQ